MTSVQFKIYSFEKKRVFICDTSAVCFMGANVGQKDFKGSLSSIVQSERTLHKIVESFRITGSVPEIVNYEICILLEGGRIYVSRLGR